MFFFDFYKKNSVDAYTLIFDSEVTNKREKKQINLAFISSCTTFVQINGMFNAK